MKQKAGGLSICRFEWKMLWNWDQKMVLLSILRVPLLVAAPFLSAYMPRLILSQLQQAPTFLDFLLPVLFLFLAMAVVNGVSQYLEGVSRYRNNTFVNFLLPLVDSKTLDMDYEILESASGQKYRQKALSAVYQGGGNLLNAYVMFGVNVSGLLFYSFLMLWRHWPLLLLMIGGAALQAYLLHNSRQYERKSRDKYTPLDQKLRYLETHTAMPASGKEIRLYRMSGFFEQLYRFYLGKRLAWSHKVQSRQFRIDIITAATRLLCDGLSYGYLAYAVVNHKLSIPDFALYFGLIGGYSGWIAGFLDHEHQLNRIHLQMKELLAFLNLPDNSHRTAEAPLPQQRPPSITLEHVCFRYQGSERDTLHDINLVIEAGEKLAVVGENGAGKTTLIKLLCGLYQPTSGRILLNGTDIRQLGRDNYFTLLSVVFQDIKILPASIAKNVAMCPAEQIDALRVERCLGMAGLLEKVRELSEGIDTLLCPAVYPEAVELSGGEAQRLALARALYKRGCILLLDEPTAALDAVAESRIYEQYCRMAQECTSLFISHRLASTRFCDRIILLKNNGIEEMGTHEELLKKKGAYAELFLLQSKYYRESCKKVDA